MPDWLTNALMDNLVGWVAAKVIDLLGGLLTLLASSLFTSPDVTVLPQVKSIADKSALVVNACFILAILAVGIATMTGDSLQMRYGVKELVPRLVVGFGLSVFSVPLTGELISIANALTVSMTGSTAPTTETVTFVTERINAALSDKSSALLVAVIGLLIVVLMFMLVGSWLARIGVLLILAGISPVALASYATPWTRGIGDLWWRTAVGSLVTPTLQAVGFSTGIDLLTNPHSNLPILLGVPGSDTLNLLLVAGVLWVTVKIPSMLRKFTMRKGSSQNIGVLVRAVLLKAVL
jgi:hypothetical protein